MASTSTTQTSTMEKQITKPEKSRRRERRTAKRSDEGTPFASGSSTPMKTKGDDASRDTGNVNGSPENARENASATGNPGFAAQEDFVPFVLSDESDQDDQPHRVGDPGKAKRPEESSGDEGVTSGHGRSNGKGKAKEEVGASVSERSKDNPRTNDPPRGPRADRGKERHRDDRDDRDRGRGGRSEDDRNRGRDDRRDHKRKYDDYDDGYNNKKQRLDASSRKCPWVTDLDWGSCRNVAEMMQLEVASFVDWISPSSIEDEIRGLIVAQVTKIVTSTFKDAQVHPFGSYQTKLYLPLGDIDLVVLSDSMAYSDKSTVLHALANALKRGGITSHVTIIAKAKVPIVKFVTTHGRFKVDISINQGNGLVSGEIISGFLKDMIPNDEGSECKALRSLIMITKAFLSQRSMNEVYTGGLGSYGIVCLAVSFLQMHPKIRRGEIDPEKNLGVLVIEFFELYGIRFNYDDVGISLRDGGTYFNKRQRGWHTEYKRNMLSIEDPAEPSNDISSGSYNFHKVRTAFAGAHGILTSTAYLRAGMLNSRRSGKSVHLRDRYEAEDLSILSTVMGITQETINHRKLVRELYDRRVLHKIVGVQPLPVAVHAPEAIPEAQDSDEAKFKVSKIVEANWRQEEDSDHGGRLHQDAREEEGGRYDIGRQPPKKRRKTGRSADRHTVFVVDDDEEDEDVRRRYDQDEEEEGEYSDMGMSESPRPSSRRKSRSYWLSKGIGIEDVDDDHY